VPVKGGQPQLVETAPCVQCSNNHGVSPDGLQLAFSDLGADGRQSRIYVMSLAEGKPRLVTPQAPAFWHGWAPDGKTLVYSAERNGQLDIYAVPVEGGPEVQLTSGAGRNDAPDYSPDAKFIYFNSDRTDLSQIWRMKPDGSEPMQVTSDAYNNWFPHPSPDGKWIAFLSYAKEVKGHPANKDVLLRLMSVRTGQIQTLAGFQGGLGSIDVPSWSRDSQNIAFVSYQPVFP
jgi:TolB protein